MHYRKELVKVITGASDSSNNISLDDVAAYSSPYLGWLSASCTSISIELLHLLKEPDSASGAHIPPISSSIWHILSVLARLISSETAISIAEIGRHLHARGFFTLDEDQEVTPQVQQLVFALLGPLTTLYKPATELPFGMLQCFPVSPRRMGMRKPKTWVSEALDISDDLVENRIRNLLVRLSGYSKGPFPTPLSPESDAAPLLSANLNYYTLAGLGQLSIQWVDSVLEHLELDEDSKTLKLFRLPSFCVMLCLRPEEHRTFLEQ